MAVKSLQVEAGQPFSGEIPEGAIRMYLTMGVQGQGQVKIGTSDPQPLYYGRNEYIMASTEGSSYTIESEEPLDVVEDFVYMPESVDAYVKQAIETATKDMQTKLDDHEARITALEAEQGNQGEQSLP